MNEKHRLILKALLLLLITQACLATTKTETLKKKCSRDDQCSPPYIVCLDDICTHKKLFPMTGIEVLLLVLFAVLQAVAGVAGIAGGIFMVPLAVLAIGFSTSQATAIANAFALMTSLSKYTIGLTKRNPIKPYKTIINYNGVIAMLPAITIFSTIGGIIASFLPEVFVLFILMLTLIASLYSGIYQLIQKVKLAKMIKMGSDVSHIEDPEEKQQIEGGTHAKPIQVVPTETVHTEREQLEPKKPALEGEAPIQRSSKPAEEGVQTDSSKELAEQRKIELSNFYYKKFLVLVVVGVLAVLVAFLRGGKSFESIVGAARCSGWDWGILAIYIIVLALIPFYTSSVIISEQRHKEKIGWTRLVEPEGVTFTKKMIVSLLLFCCFVGVLSTVIGIGGAVLLIPLLTFYGFKSVTSSYIITVNTLISKVAAVVIHIVSGDLMTDYTLFFGVIITVASVASEFGALFIVRKLKSQLIYPIIFVFMVLLSLILTLYVGIDKWVKDSSKGINVWKFKSYC